MKNVNFSFIIPHKNSPELLRRCLQSIPQRDDIQIIIIDDNSDKNIVDFKNFPGKGKKYIELYFTKTNKGAGYARNIGLKYAKGKWILFPDADDFYTDKLNNLLDKYLNNDSTDIVYLNAQIINDELSTSPYIFNSYIQNYNNKTFYSEKNIRYGVWTPWTRMVKNDIIKSNGLYFEEIPIGNDVLFCLKCSKYAKNIAVENNIIYNYYRPKAGSLTDKKYSLHSLDSRIINTLKMNELYSSVNYFFKGSIIEMLIPFKTEFNNKKDFFNFIFNTYKKYNYNIIIDLINYLKYRIGIKLHII